MQPLGMVALVRPPHHHGLTLARDPHDGALDAGVQVAAVVVVGEESIEFSKQAHHASLR
jgi:hypothetical protein